MIDIVVGVLAIVGALFMLLAGIGVVRLRDIYARMHAATKASTIGTILIATAGAIAIDHAAPKIILAAVVIFITAPSAAHFVGRAAYRAEGIAYDLERGDDLGRFLDDEANE